MADSEDKKKSSELPAWQLKSPNVKDPSASAGTSDASSRSSLLEQAKKFLLEDEVRNSTTEKKIAFLESKGLSGDDIQEVLGVARNPEASSSQSDQEAMPQPPSTPSAPPPQPPMSQQPRDTPPIITYPEFLTTPAQPAPLITAQRLLTTLYLFGGLSALLYGSSTYLIKPMVASLTASRLSLAETAQSNLQNLITKLSATVSSLPSSTTPHPAPLDQDSDSDSDPTELFHRDIGIQTSLPTTPHLSPSRPLTPQPPPTPLTTHTTSLSTITTHLTSLLETSTSESSTTSDLLTSVDAVRQQLLTMLNPPSSIMYGDGLTSMARRKIDEDGDQIAKLKATIRGVKGVFLSTKSFPAGPPRYPPPVE